MVLVMLGAAPPPSSPPAARRLLSPYHPPGGTVVSATPEAEPARGDSQREPESLPCRGSRGAGWHPWHV